MGKKKKQSTNVSRLIDELAKSEQSFLAAQFLAPVLSGGTVQVKIGDAVCQIKVAPSDYSGIGLFEPLSFTEAVLVRDATLAERKRYLALFPSVRLIACQRRGSSWLGCLASAGDLRFRIDGLAPIALAEEVQLFDTLICRFDGNRFWFDEADLRVDPRHASELRTLLEQQTDPASISLPGLSAEMRAAYELAHWQRYVEPLERARRNDDRTAEQTAQQVRHDNRSNESHSDRERLSESLSHAGARLISYIERNDSFQVTFQLDGRQHTSAIDKDDLTIFSSGICLDGQDRDFDLTSLVGVLREGRRTGEF